MLLMNRDLNLLLYRVFLGILMVGAHGWPKLMRYSDLKNTFADPLGVGPHLTLILVLFAEVLCPILVALGVFYRWSLAPIIFAMGVAAFVVHAQDPFSRKELAIMYLLAYLFLFFSGSGKFAIDIRKGKKS
jgi:putative oxidoreductase